MNVTEQLQGAFGRLAYKGYDDYWTEDCQGDESETWAMSAKRVLKAHGITSTEG